MDYLPEMSRPEFEELKLRVHALPNGIIKDDFEKLLHALDELRHAEKKLIDEINEDAAETEKDLCEEQEKSHTLQLEVNALRAQITEMERGADVASERVEYLNARCDELEVEVANLSR